MSGTLRRYEKKGVSYKTELITTSQQVNSEGCNCISFENIGNDDATLKNDIPLKVANVAREFNNDSECIIQDNFRIKFAGNSTNKMVLVIKTFIN